jgi:Uma2 family endonuclease
LVRKKELYQKFGVKEYWIIDPDTKESLGFTLKDGIFKEAGIYKAKIKPLLLNQDFAF